MAKTDRKMVDNPVVIRIVQCIKKKGKRERDLTDYLGLPPGSMSKWKYDGSYVYVKYIYEICEYLEVTPNYLFFGPEDEEDRLSLQEKEMIRMYRTLDNERKQYIKDTLGYVMQSNRKKKNSSK